MPSALSIRRLYIRAYTFGIFAAALIYVFINRFSASHAVVSAA